MCLYQRLKLCNCVTELWLYSVCKTIMQPGVQVSSVQKHNVSSLLLCQKKKQKNKKKKEKGEKS